MATSSKQSPAWTSEDLQKDPHDHSQKSPRVREMFNAIAPAYDLNNTLHSFGRDRAWRKRTVSMCSVGSDSEVLDVACGTGALSEAFLEAGAARVVGLDYTPGMLDIAREKATRAQLGSSLEYVQGDAMDLPFEDSSFDVLSIAFGIRNVVDPSRAFAEFSRVLRPGGRLVVLEFAEPKNPLLRWGNAFYTRHIMPRTASLIAKDTSGAYKYLPKSIETFLTPSELREKIEAENFVMDQQVTMTFGVCVASLAVRKP